VQGVDEAIKNVASCAGAHGLGTRELLVAHPI